MSTPVTITIPHKLGRAEARSRVEASIGQFKDQQFGGSVGGRTRALKAPRTFSRPAIPTTVIR